MRQCQGIVTHVYGVTLTGYPDVAAIRCRRTVAVHPWTDVLGVERAACSEHRLTVELRSRAEEMAERARHGMEPEPVARRESVQMTGPRDWIGVRPEMVRRMM